MSDPQASQPLPIHAPGAQVSRSRHKRLFLLIALALMTAVVVIGAVLRRLDGPFGVDNFWQSLAQSIRTPELLAFSEFANIYGGGLWAVALDIAVVLIVWAASRRWQAAVFVATAVAVSYLIVSFLKPLFDRARPEDVLVATHDESFPSGHTSNIAVLTIAVAIVFGRWWLWILAALATLAMAFSRTLLSAHWFSDVVSGAAIGAGAAVLCWVIVLWFRQRREQRSDRLQEESRSLAEQ
ncbi:phosphatase PAP2 family protein [Humidisolicoccus flavus]|uniref:phosphatase PAP2 family protein n=1 Tax=Humidisolicoccus flavus TaxID=3111414 RepID=UPI00325414A6